MKEREIKVLMVEPMKHPEVVLLENNLKDLQEAVGGLIEIINLEEDICLLCNDEGKLIDLPGNRRIGDDIIAGVFYICGSDEENLCSLANDKLEYYRDLFFEPEEFKQDEVQKKCKIRFISWD